MKNRLKILFLSSEVAPFAKTGGLADVSSALPKAFFDLGHDVRIMMPKYGSINERKYVLREVIRLKKIPVTMGGVEYITSAKSAFIPDTKVQVYFLEYKPFFDRADLYVDPKTKLDYPDNPERYALFCKAVVQTIKVLHWEPQIIHCNDWQTALIPWMLRNSLNQDPFFARTRSLLSIHNLAYQGTFSSEHLPGLGIPESLAESGSEMEFYGKLNFLKAGILNADTITTVSPTYAREIQGDSDLSSGLGDVLQSRRRDIYGILNGADYTLWDPETDPLIARNYSAASLKDKVENKRTLCEKCGMSFDPDIPVIGMISRLTEQKGFDLICDGFDELMALGVQLVILGTGDPKYHDELSEWCRKYPQQTALHLRFDNNLAHLIEAGSDIFLMPSRFEPCGLNQMYSMKYGTIPVVRNTGGLADTVIDAAEQPGKGTGFLFEAFESGAMIAAVRNAKEAYNDRSGWGRLMKRAMKNNFSWTSAAEKYIKLYSKLENKRQRN